MTKREILASSKLNEFPDDNFIFDEMEESSSNEWKTMRKEIAHYEQFLLFSQCFQRHLKT